MMTASSLAYLDTVLLAVVIKVTAHHSSIQPQPIKRIPYFLFRKDILLRLRPHTGPTISSFRRSLCILTYLAADARSGP
ncbi:hypothetical protein GGR54DRAFT_616658 [Hypoxylon sp. NC1633]|nr:hypothetical protein GGR54DRAFT_616658 [Hypoxylon sp. NC1633]